ncbi:LysR family transcriptional regulator [Alteromonas lipolytica]|uniref:LysR family transcriptional regulator n=1 Tax=Alteromonas lipolytica TaxID=1856405 RepID=A0A1E8FJG9_9ALTE|nr:LysR family transcriptional regulator [Alteromonas lipolytica]OFI36072.1 LysR family transcriptional regulator [Alteromonas lipolytica]GGF71197.1 transcriptional activator NhaR [Alteromonas lipolytica]
MNQINYHHLYYFYLIAREGSIASAARLLHVTPQTASGQLSTFEKQLGYPLFDRVNKRLHLNSKGKLVFQHASDIFQKGNQLAKLLHANNEAVEQTFVIGITDAIPKVLAYDFVHHTMSQSDSVRFIFREGPFDSLISDLAINQIDMIIADRGVAPGTRINAHSYFLGESHLSFFASATNRDHHRDFPDSLNGASLLLPGEKSGITLGLTSWLEANQLFPKIVAEFDDSALLKVFGSEGMGVFCAPSAIARHVADFYNVVCIGEIDEISERFYAITGKGLSPHTLTESIVAEARGLLGKVSHG